ncbi:MAG: DUF1573 domain-containing protein [Bryobacteraceae bacterium]
MRLGSKRLAWALMLAFTWADGAAAQTADERLRAVRKQIQQAEVFDFGIVRQTDLVEHTFQVRNPGDETLVVKNVQLTPPLTITKMSRQIRPGETGSVTVQLGQPRPAGDFEGLIVVQFTREDAPEVFFRVQGRVVRPIDFDPFPAFYITTFRGESKQQSIEITNNQSEPLKFLKVEDHSPRIAVDLATIEPGRRYRLTVTVKPDAVAGKMTGSIRLLTSDERQPVIRIPVNTQVRERVYTFPDAIALGLIDTVSLKRKPEQAAYLTQSVTVYQRNGTGFEIAAETDLPFLRISKRQAHLKDRFEVLIEVIPEKLKAGSFDGSIRITTNDREFPLLAVPLTCAVKDDW